METGDLVLRHDVEVLAGEGYIRAPITTWPLSWPDISRDINRIDPDVLSPAARAAYRRLKRRMRAAARVDRPRRHFRVSAGKSNPIRTFEKTPRGEAELEAGVEWMGERFAYRLQGTLVLDPDDGKKLRLDGSYAGFVLGNWMFSASSIDRWWGPGWDAALIVSSNARPIPMLTLERNYSDPFELPVLRWLGPWKVIAFMGQLESSRAIPDAWLFGFRANFKPFNGDLELGLSRTALWCGDGRPCGFGTFTELLAGVDNTGTTDEPGNQLAGGDLRWVSPFTDHPYAIYGEVIGEDEAGGLPSKRIGLFGIETWGYLKDATFHLHLEYADTAVRGFYADPEFNIAYEHGIYQTGYRYRGRSIGHAMDNDGQMFSAGVTIITEEGQYWNLLMRFMDLNRDGVGTNSVSPVAREILNLELSNRRDLRGAEFHWGLGLDRIETANSGDTEYEARLFAELLVAL